MHRLQNEEKRMNKRKTLLIRVGLILLLAVLSTVLFITGKGYTLLLDNKTVESAGGEWRALDSAVVIVDKQEPVELFRRDRVSVEVKGSRHVLKVIIRNRMGQETDSKTVPINLKLGSRYYLLSIPGLIQEGEGWLTPFSTEDNS